MDASRIWLITGASSGFGLELAKIASGRGDRVIAATRSPQKADGLAGLPGVTVARLDHNEPLPQIQAAIEDILGIHSTVDIVVNNAAYVQTGTVEELTPEETLRQFQANTFGPINVYRAILPHLRQKRGGTLVTIGSMAAWFPMRSSNAYNASKAALRRLTLGLADEVAHLGIRHCLVEPGFFRTGLLKPGANVARTADTARDPDYGALNAAADRTFAAIHGNQAGDTVAGCEVIYEVVTSSGRAAGRELPGFLPLGGDAVDEIRESAQRIIDEVREWEDIARQSDFPNGK
ncbi:NAD(P)-binding protein [Hypoxylon sp. NC1633]|nr:NAD(P)-binding protein [Hypoxylon sp. NC1633]